MVHSSDTSLLTSQAKTAKNLLAMSQVVAAREAAARVEGPQPARE